jgi:propanol-preferring alcohol dehydrogenase
MRAMLLDAPGTPLRLAEVAVPEPAAGEILVKVDACGVCRTDLHVRDGDLTGAARPAVLGHEIVGTVAAAGPGASRWTPGSRVGVPWLARTCGQCGFCRSGRENLCAQARFTGYQVWGGFAEYCVADERYVFAVPPGSDAVEVAPLLCAGLIGYRALRKAGDAPRLGLYGFGAAAHIVAQVARHEGRRVFAFTRPGDVGGQDFARSLGVDWAGDSTTVPPETLDAAIIFAPVGSLVPAALAAVAPGGTVVCAGIHMTDIPAFPYELLWGERVVCSVANLTRRDGDEFFELLSRVPVRTTVQRFALDEAEEALRRLREGRLQGAGVLVP